MGIVRLLIAFGPDNFEIERQEFAEEKMAELKPLFTPYPGDPDLIGYTYFVEDDIRAEVGRILGVELNPEWTYQVEAAADE